MSKNKNKTVYDFSAQTIDGSEKPLADYQGKVLLIVNVASKCGFTPQYDGLQKLYDDYKSQGLEILGFPCNQFMSQEPGNEDDIKNFCRLNYGVSFDMFKKIDVNGGNAHPLYQYLVEKLPGLMGLKGIKWNFTKFLIDRHGNPVKRYAPNTEPESIVEDIQAELAKP